MRGVANPHVDSKEGGDDPEKQTPGAPFLHDNMPGIEKAGLPIDLGHGTLDMNPSFAPKISPVRAARDDKEPVGESRASLRAGLLYSYDVDPVFAKLLPKPLARTFDLAGGAPRFKINGREGVISGNSEIRINFTGLNISFRD